MVTEDGARFPKSYRLRTREEFKFVFAQRASVSDSQLIVYAADNGRNHCRLGLVVSKKVGFAVERNRWKRLIREAFRQHQAQLPPGLDLVILPPRCAQPEWETIHRGLLQLVERVARKVRRKRIESTPEKDPPL